MLFGEGPERNWEKQQIRFYSIFGAYLHYHSKTIRKCSASKIESISFLYY